MSKPVVAVSVLGFGGLKELGLPLSLDNYQRPYVWGAGKIKQLCDDFSEYQAQKGDVSDYYMGTLLLHKNKEKGRYFVIDGQQRLTSLLVLQQVLEADRDDVLRGFDFVYRSTVSAVNIKNAMSYFDENAIGVISAEIFRRLCFTVIVVDREDLAFTFFDTQNNRGVPLKATDLLKAFHLRAIRSNSSQHEAKIQTLCAQRWEHIQLSGAKSRADRNADFAAALFNEYLWRARCWKGSLLRRETHDLLIECFQEKSVPVEEIDQLPLYPGHFNRHSSLMSLTVNDGYLLQPVAIEVGSHSALLPFSIRQPIHQGVGFFLYAEKYSALINLIFHEETDNQEIIGFRAFYDAVVRKNSMYLQELYRLAALMYFDQFGSDQLHRFLLFLDHLLGAVRLNKAYIFKEATLIVLRQSSQNLLDVIAGAFRPQEVIDYLVAAGEQAELNDEGYMAQRVLDVERASGVRGAYLDALLNYYEKNDLVGKDKWMDAKYSGAIRHG